MPYVGTVMAIIPLTCCAVVVCLQYFNLFLNPSTGGQGCGNVQWQWQNRLDESVSKKLLINGYNLNENCRN